MKQHILIKIKHIKNGMRFINTKDDSNYYHITPFSARVSLLHRNDILQEGVFALIHNDRLVVVGNIQGTKQIKTMNLENVQFLDLEIIEPIDFVPEQDNYYASFDGEQVSLISGEVTFPPKLKIESDLFSHE